MEDAGSISDHSNSKSNIQLLNDAIAVRRRPSSIVSSQQMQRVCRRPALLLLVYDRQGTADVSDCSRATYPLIRALLCSPDLS